jgi:hypothetical protein
MFAARTIGAVLTLIAALLVAVGVRASRQADGARVSSLRRSGRTVGEFFGVWLLRDGVELALLRDAWTTAHHVDLVCIVAGTLLALGAIAAGSVPAGWLADARALHRVRVSLFVMATLAAASASARLLV